MRLAVGEGRTTAVRAIRGAALLASLRTGGPDDRVAAVAAHGDGVAG